MTQDYFTNFKARNEDIDMLHIYLNLFYFLDFPLQTSFRLELYTSLKSEDTLFSILNFNFSFIPFNIRIDLLTKINKY